MKKTCEVCWKTENLKLCSGCKTFYFCGKDCQQKHWRTVHKTQCKHFNTLTIQKALQNIKTGKLLYPSFTFIFSKLQRNYDGREIMKNPDADSFGLEIHQIACTLNILPILKELSENQLFHDMFFTKKFFISRSQQSFFDKFKITSNDVSDIYDDNEEEMESYLEIAEDDLSCYQFCFLLSTLLSRFTTSNTKFSNESIVQICRLNGDPLVRISCGSALSEQFSHLIRQFGSLKKKLIIENGGCLGAFFDIIEDEMFAGTAISFLNSLQQNDWKLIKQDDLKILIPFLLKHLKEKDEFKKYFLSILKSHSKILQEMIKSNPLQNEYFNYFNQELKNSKDDFEKGIEKLLDGFQKLTFDDRFKYEYQCWSKSSQEQWDAMKKIKI
eukprot:gene7812-12285_t